MSRITAMASPRASTASPGERRGPPMVAMASQKPPAPRPSSKRPPLSRSMEAAALASTAGGRRGRLATSGNSRIRDVRAASVDRRTQEST